MRARRRWLVAGVVLALVLWLGVLVLTFDRVILTAVASPSGARVAVVHGLGEGGSPPYGMQLVVLPAWVPMKNLFGEPIFRGYCISPITLRWRRETELELTCASYDGVQEKREHHDATRIRYRALETVGSAPNN